MFALPLQLVTSPLGIAQLSLLLSTRDTILIQVKTDYLAYRMHSEIKTTKSNL